jgi:hypothetical protein
MTSVTKNKKEKFYYCEYMSKDGLCKESKEENFEKGRYNICRECRRKQSKNYRESFKEEKIKEIDPMENFKFLIKNHTDDKFASLNKSVFKNDEKIDKAIELEYRRSVYLQQCIEKLFFEIEDIKKENEFLKKQVKKLSMKSKSEDNLDFMDNEYNSKILPDLTEMY